MTPAARNIYNILSHITPSVQKHMSVVRSLLGPSNSWGILRMWKLLPWAATAKMPPKKARVILPRNPENRRRAVDKLPVGTHRKYLLMLKEKEVEAANKKKGRGQEEGAEKNEEL